MSLFSRRSALMLSGAFAVSGCLKPMLAQDEAATALRNRISLPNVDDRFGYFLAQSLEDRLGRPKSPDFRLDVQTTVSEEGLAIAQDNSVTRVTLLARASWSLWREGGQSPILSDSLSVQSGYNATTSLYATRQIRLDIERRLARDLGERISRSILARSQQITA